MPEASGLASSTIDGGGTTSSTAGEEAVVTAGGGLRVRRVIVFEPAPCARRIFSGF
jgi:hypothetical protein